ncbi:MAG: ABC transporter substrate-binding protein [Clostridia bacterium]|nr:ABC transporter substrate-binding protein [Clostridia bacterium]
MKKIIAVFIAVITVMSLAACGTNGGTSTTAPQGQTATSTGTQGKKTEIYFLNFKPEAAEVYDRIAADYEKETGVKLKVVTAASNTYEQTLTGEIAKSDAPTIFQINGPVGFRAWKKYCADLKDTKFYSFLTDKSLAITEDGGVYGIPYVIEGYGIIYNEEITDKYFALGDKKTELTSMAQINSFKALKELVEDMQAHKDELGIDGVFASTSMASGNQWRWTTHLANVPFYYEFSENGEYSDTVSAALDAPETEFKYSDNMKNLFSLYTDNSVTEKKLLGSKSVADSMSEFALGKAAMVQNGTWAWSEIADVAGNTVKEDKIKFLPLYTGVDGEEKQGLCVGTENYLAVNSTVSEEKQKASVDFLEWLFGSETGKKYVVNELNFVTPFNTFDEDELPKEPLAAELVKWTAKKDIKSVPWTFAAFPGDAFKSDFASALLSFVQGSAEWDEVKNTVRNSWKDEYEALNS